jgi:hypothetical protein
MVRLSYIRAANDLDKLSRQGWIIRTSCLLPSATSPDTPDLVVLLQRRLP